MGARTTLPHSVHEPSYGCSPEIYLPILEAHLHSEEVDRMVEAMERTVKETKSNLKAIATGK
jgi:hypothetical protein